MAENLVSARNSSEVEVVNYITKSYALAAESNSALMSTQIAPSRNTMEIVKSARVAFQKLYNAASNSVATNPRTKSVTPVSRSANSCSVQGILRGRSNSVVSVQSATAPSQSLKVTTLKRSKTPLLSHAEIEAEETKKRAISYNKGTSRPNVHTALHYSAVIQEYGLPVHCNVLIGEDKHREGVRILLKIFTDFARYFKKIVYLTNHQNGEKALLARRTSVSQFDLF